jgi:hypothetical protein
MPYDVRRSKEERYVRVFIIVMSLVAAALSGPAVAQEGHPLKGSWIGDWGPSKLHSDDLLLVLNWDGKAITGMVNPGTDNLTIKNASLAVDGWVLRFEAAGKDLTYSFEGKIDNLPLHNRTITGTWKSAKESGKFKVGRQ